VGDQESCSHLQQTTKFRGSGWSQRLSFPEQKGGSGMGLLNQLAGREGFEPPTDGFGDRCSTN
jgi:hypothetical protein